MENLIKVLKLIKVKKVAKYLEWVVVYQSNRGVPYHKVQRGGMGNATTFFKIQI